MAQPILHGMNRYHIYQNNLLCITATFKILVIQLRCIFIVSVYDCRVYVEIPASDNSGRHQ